MLKFKQVDSLLDSLPVSHICTLDIAFGVCLDSEVPRLLRRMQPALEAEVAVDLSL